MLFITGSLTHCAIKPGVRALGASAGDFAIVAAYIGLTIMRWHEFRKFVKSFRSKLGFWWWFQALAIWQIFNGTIADLDNVAHHGGTVAGILMTLTLLNLQGVYRLTSLTLWILSCIVWIRISSKMDQRDELFYPRFHEEFNDTLINNYNVTDCVSRCLPEDFN